MRVTVPAGRRKKRSGAGTSVLRGHAVAGGGPGSPNGWPLAQRAERRSDLGREELGLFPGGEVASFAGLVEVDEVGVGLLDPAARGREDLAGEGGEADRELDLRRSLPGRESLGSAALPVRPSRRGTGAG